ncbi:effector-associated constant component EACC1 [Streptomyces sp. NPDC004270]
MRVLIATTAATAADGGQDAVRDLYRWLREDPDVRRSATPTLVPVPDAAEQRPGTAMGAVEIIELVLGQGFSALNLALAYAAWRGQRPAAPPIVIQLGEGRSVTVHDGSAETVRRIVAALEDPTDRPQAAAAVVDPSPAVGPAPVVDPGPDPDGTGAGTPGTPGGS